jgi:hypothetical protein
MKKLITLISIVIAAILTPACNTIDDERIPTMAVNISLTPEGVWHTYGVAGYGLYKYFIKDQLQPSGFPYTDKTYTGFGGVLLISGMDPFTTEAGVPLAYDLACPVERKANIRVKIQSGDNLPDAVCPECGSHYNVVEGGGAPTSGPALTSKYGLSRYSVVASSYGGYVITNKSY